MVKFAYTIFYVRDVSKAVSFYENAFDFKRKFISPENDYAEIATGETTLSFASFTLTLTNLSTGFIESDLKNKAFGTEIGLVTENVEEVVKSALSAGAVLLEKPKKNHAVRLWLIFVIRMDF